MPPKRSTPKVYHRAIQLRKEPTTAEAKLWAYLRGNKLDGVNFRRQHAIGKYIVDFCSLKKKLVIELDGSQHLGQEEYDQERTLYLKSQGYRVIRFWNDQVMNDMEGVIKTIVYAIDSSNKDGQV
jgi:very-short-patch-repair endonuclease